MWQDTDLHGEREGEFYFVPLLSGWTHFCPYIIMKAQQASLPQARCTNTSYSKEAVQVVWPNGVYHSPLGPVPCSKSKVISQTSNFQNYPLFHQPMQRKMCFDTEMTISASFNIFTVTVILNFPMIVLLPLVYHFCSFHSGRQASSKIRD